MQNLFPDADVRSIEDAVEEAVSAHFNRAKSYIDAVKLREWYDSLPHDTHEMLHPRAEEEVLEPSQSPYAFLNSAAMAILHKASDTRFARETVEFALSLPGLSYTDEYWLHVTLWNVLERDFPRDSREKFETFARVFNRVTDHIPQL